MVNDQLTMVNGQLLTINCNVLVKSRKVRHFERSEAISWVITICNYWIPAFAGMTVKGYIRLFTKPSLLIDHC